MLKFPDSIINLLKVQLYLIPTACHLDEKLAKSLLFVFFGRL